MPGATIPKLATPGSAALDVYSCLPPDTIVRIAPGTRICIPTGLQFEIPPGYFISIRPRSGLALKAGLCLPNAPGTIDADYRGELQILVANMDPKNVIEIHHGERIAQLLLEKRVDFLWQESEKPFSIEGTQRRDGAWGSTGLA